MECFLRNFLLQFFLLFKVFIICLFNFKFLLFACLYPQQHLSFQFISLALRNLCFSDRFLNKQSIINFFYFKFFLFANFLSKSHLCFKVIWFRCLKCLTPLKCVLLNKHCSNITQHCILSCPKFICLMSWSSVKLGNEITGAFLRFLNFQLLVKVLFHFTIWLGNLNQFQLFLQAFGFLQLLSLLYFKLKFPSFLNLLFPLLTVLSISYRDLCLKLTNHINAIS